MKTKIIYSIGFVIGSAFGLSAQCPTAAFTTSAPECKNQNISFNNSSGNTGGGWSYQWDFDFGGNGNVSPQNSNNQNPNGIQYNGTGSYTVSMTISGNGCPTSTSTMIVDIEKARADFGLSANQVCLGQTVDFFNSGSTQGTGSSSVTHFWDFGTGATPATSTLENPGSVTYTSVGAKNVTHYVTVNYPSCGKTKTNQVSQTITVNPQPIVSFNSTAPVCEGSTVDFTYTGSTSSIDQFNWDFGNGALPAMSSAQNSSGILYNTSGSKTISLTVTNQYGCVNTVAQGITINTIPLVSFSTTSTSAQQCTGLGVDFNNTGTAGASYTWGFGSGSTPASSLTENPTNIVYSTPGVKTISLLIDNGICTNTVSSSITIHETPTVNFNTTAPQCAELGVDLTNTGSTGFNFSYNWDLGQDATPSTSNSENPIGVSYSTGGNKVITLTVSDQFCTSTSTSTINIFSLPIANAGFDTTICPNTTVQIGTTNNSNYTYNWFPSTLLVISNPTISNPIASPVANVTDYILTVSDNVTGCINSDSAIVTMLKPLIADAGVDLEICRNDSVQIGASLIEGQNYNWAPTLGLSDSISSNSMATPDSTITYTLTVSDDYGCSTIMDEVTVIVNQLPIANAGIDDSMTINHSVQLVATGGVQYVWESYFGLSNAGIYNPVASPDSTTEYVVFVTDIKGCLQTDTVRVVVLTPSFWAPTAFSPDGDLINDIFYIRGNGIDNFEFSVFDQYGHVIFKTNEINIGWDGSYLNTGDLLPKGAYVYHISGTLSNGDLVNKTDMINLIR